MKKLLLLLLIMMPLSARNTQAEKVARSWCDFGKQVLIDGTITFGALRLYELLKNRYFSHNSPALPFAGLVLLVGSWRLSRDLKEITEVLPPHYSMWASLWGIVLGATAFNNK